MKHDDSSTDYWSLSPAQLAKEIALIANADPVVVDDVTHGEAGLLAKEWQETLSLPRATFQDQQHQVALLDSLQKRTIEILVRANRSE